MNGESPLQVRVDRARSRLRPTSSGPPPKMVGQVVGLYILTISAALVLTAGMIVLVGGSPFSVANSLYQGSISNGTTFGETLNEAMPILLVAVGTTVTVRAGLFNIGQEGQLTAGAIVGAAIALNWHGPGPLVLVATLLGAAVGGAALTGLSALIFQSRNVNVIISTLLISYVADQILSYVLSSPRMLQQPVTGSQVAAEQSNYLSGSVRLPTLGHGNGFSISSGVLLALIILIVSAVILAKTKWGFRLRMVGHSASTARAFGISGGVASVALIVSGALSGLAGGTMLTGTVFRLQGGFSGNVATDGLLAALVANDIPLALIPISLAFGIVETGGTYLVSSGIPPYIAQVLESLLVLAAVLPPLYMRRPAWLTALIPKRPVMEEVTS